MKATLHRGRFSLWNGTIYQLIDMHATSVHHTRIETVHFYSKFYTIISKSKPVIHFLALQASFCVVYCIGVFYLCLYMHVRGSGSHQMRK